MKSLSDLLTKKRNLEAEREELIRRLEEVDLEIANTKTEYGALYNNDSPILSLPAEVTCLIFSKAFSTLEFIEEDGDVEDDLIEVTISHVCRQWRSAAIEFPYLWSTFYYHGPSATRATLDRFKVYLDRSKSHTLELLLDLRKTTSDPQLLAIDMILDQTIEVVSRWRVVSVFSNSKKITSRLQVKFEDLHAPNLEHLTLHLNHQNRASESHWVTSLESQCITHGAPKLTSSWLDVSASFCLPPISTVTTLRIEMKREAWGPTLLLFSAALRSIFTLPNLENLSLVNVARSGPDFNVPNVMDKKPILMNRLRHLRISGSATVCDLLPTIRAPLLESLILRNMNIALGVEPFTDTRAPNVYSFPSLMSLSLLKLYCDSGDSFLYMARMTSAARKITIQGTGILQSTSVHAQADLWPHLDNLACNGPFDFHLNNGEPLCTFLMHRESTENLTLLVSDGWMDYMKKYLLSDAKFARVLLLKEVTGMELGKMELWPPGRSHSDKFELADSFITSKSTGFGQHLL